MFDDITVRGFAMLCGVLVGALLNVRLAMEARRREAPVADVYQWLAASTALLCVATLAKYLSPTRTAALAAEWLYYTALLGGATVFVLFTVVYVGYGGRLTRRRVALLAVEPAAFLAVLATDPLHGLLRTDVHLVRFEGLTLVAHQPSPLMMAHIGYTFLLTVAGYALLVRFYFRTRNVYRKQTGVIFLGSLLIPVSAFLYTGGVTPIDPTPFALVVNGAVVWVALFSYDFLDVMPLAADLLIEEMEDGVIVTGPDGEILDVNGAAERLFTSGDVLGDPLAVVAPALVTAVDDGKPFVLPPGDDGTYPTTFDPSVTTIYDQFDIRRGRLIVLRDVTLQAHRQAELERQNERLEEFASVVSHDLRNPLAVAKGYAEMAHETGDVSNLDRTFDAFDRMDELIDDLLTLAREGRAVDDAEAVSLAAVADRAWRSVDAPDATLYNEFEGTVRADETRLRELLENLFRNAVEHAGPGVTLRIGETATGFYVEDDGPGVSEADRESVFDRGFSSSPDGTGFGLSIVETIADAHGWSVELSVGSDGGARFEFSDLGSPLRPAYG